MEKLKLYILNNKKIFIIIGCLLFIALCSFGCYFYYQYTKQNEIIIDETLFSDNDINIVETDDNQDETLQEESNNLEEVNEKIIEYIYVDIKGYVNKPGVYKVEKNGNKRIYDLITLAGGLKKDADTSIINMSTRLKDEMVVIIYSKQEVEDFVKTKENLVDKIEICEKDIVKNDACICEDNINNNYESDNNGTNYDKDVSSNISNANNGDENANSKININTASQELLMTLDGIGESKALAIISYRNEIGLFQKIEDIKNVSGIGDSAFEKIKNFITVK